LFAFLTDKEYETNAMRSANLAKNCAILGSYAYTDPARSLRARIEPDEYAVRIERKEIEKPPILSRQEDGKPIFSRVDAGSLEPGLQG
jgi:hypothetical protein